MGKWFGRFQTLIDICLGVAALLAYILCLSIGEFDYVTWTYEDTSDSGEFVGRSYLQEFIITKKSGPSSIKDTETASYKDNTLCTKEFYEKYHLNGDGDACRNIRTGSQITLACVGLCIIFVGLSVFSALMGIFFERGFEWAGRYINFININNNN